MNPLAFIIFCSFIIFCVCYIFRPFVIVNEGENIVVERLGRYHRTLSTGIHPLVPLFEKLRTVYWKHDIEEQGRRKTFTFSDYRIRMTESICDILPVECNTKDNVKVIINMITYYKVIDACKAVYNTDNLFAMMVDDLETRVVKVVKSMENISAYPL